MKKIESRFNELFAPWAICLPPGDIEQRKRGRIVQAGWAIWYLFGRDDQGEYLDHYSSHRMTTDCHERIREDGTHERLPAISTWRLSSEDPVEDARLEAEHFAENQEIEKLLQEKGFGITGDEPGGVQVNRFLRLGKLDK
jgi:hypothetical protein